MKTVTDSQAASGEDTVTTADLMAKAAEVEGTVEALAAREPAGQQEANMPGLDCRREARERAYRALAAWFVARGWTPLEMRAAEHTFFAASPVADAMERLLALRVTCEAAIQRVACGLDGCGACAGRPCDGETGIHVVRLGSAMKRRVITGGQLVEALRSAGLFTGSTVIRPDGDR